MVEGRARLDSAVREGVMPDKGAGATQDNTLKPEETRGRLSSLGGGKEAVVLKGSSVPSTRMVSHFHSTL